MSLVKAQLISSDGGGTIEFMFNPTELNFSESINITKNEGARTSRGLPKVNFAYPESCKLTISDILLDTYEQGGGKSVLTYLHKFQRALDFTQGGSGKDKRPPTFVFTWGKHQFVRCFVTSLNYKLTMFLPDGTPVRAKLDLTLEEIDEPISQPGMGTPSNVNRSGDNRRSRS
ncbi:MAG: hypothetical protein SWZ49_16650 [Cyanobacteriota bacterium]|nr:hypothetical protein [Cyanobacteriota bacterium]